MPSAKLRVAICTDGIFPRAIGGMQRHSRLLVDELSSLSELELHVIHPHPGQKFFGENVLEYALEGIDKGKNYLHQCYRYSVRVENALSEIQPDVVFSQGLAVWKNRSRWKNKWIIHPHGLEPFQAIGLKAKIVARPFRLVFRRLFRSAHTTVSLGGQLTTILKAQDANRIVEIPNATASPILKEVSVQKFKHDKTRMLYVARLEHNKGVHILLQGIEELIDSGLPVELDIVGKGSLAGLIRSYSSRYIDIRFHEGISEEDLRHLYNDAHVFVFPTLFEGMPTVVLEAMAAGLPVIVSNTGATAVQVDQSNGRLISRNDLPALKEAVRWFVGLSGEEKAKLGNSSLRKVHQSFTWSAVARRFKQLFENVARD